MSSDFMARMGEATRMTREGRAGEATAMIQALLRGEAGPTVEVFQPAARPPARPQAKRGGRAGLRETLRRLAERARATDVEEAPAVPDGARFETARVRTPHGERDYKLYVPAAPADAPRPLVVMLHGCTQHPDDFARGTGMNALAEEFGVIVVYPRQPQSANPNRCWNWFRPEDQRRDAGEAALVAQIARTVAEREDVDPARVYVAGMSAGGAAAANLGVAYPDLFAAIGVHSGLPSGAAQDLPSALNAMRAGAPGAGVRSAPAIVFHGDADHVVNPRNGEAVAAQAGVGRRLALRSERGEAGGRAFTRALHQDAGGVVVCEHWTLRGAGHAWSGGDAAGSHTDAAGPNASREMLRFFLSHRL